MLLKYVLIVAIFGCGSNLRLIKAAKKITLVGRESLRKVVKF